MSDEIFSGKSITPLWSKLNELREGIEENSFVTGGQVWEIFSLLVKKKLLMRRKSKELPLLF